MELIPHWIDGAALMPIDGGWLDVHEPATGEVYARVAQGGRQEVRLAYAAAQRAFPAWSGLPAMERARWMEKLAAAIESRLESFAKAESRDAGKPLALCRDIEIPRAIANLRFFSHAATQFASESHHGHAGLNYTLRDPLGVVATISPWNLPLYLFTWKIAPALAAGNTVLAKPSEITPMTAAMLGDVAAEIGFPRGVLNIIQGTGSEVGEVLVKHPGVRAVSFTGSTKVGRRIAKLAGDRLKKVSLELGGKNATILFADSDWEHQMDTLVRSAFQNSGQICLCGSRILVERSIYARFRDAFVKRVRALRIGEPAHKLTQLGPMTSQAQFEKTLAAIQRAKNEGGNILCGGYALERRGWFIAPTVIDHLGATCSTNREEIFGPVVTLQTFDEDEEAIALANATDYGLATSIWTRDLERAHRLAREVRSGIVWINCWMQRDLRTPFGGMGQSGIGREGGMEAMRFFTEAKNVGIAL